MIDSSDPSSDLSDPSPPSSPNSASSPSRDADKLARAVEIGKDLKVVLRRSHNRGSLRNVLRRRHGGQKRPHSTCSSTSENLDYAHKRPHSISDSSNLVSDKLDYLMEQNYNQSQRSLQIQLEAATQKHCAAMKQFQQAGTCSRM